MRFQIPSAVLCVAPCVALWAACAVTEPQPSSSAESTLASETLFHGGRIYVDARLDPVQALLVREGFVVAAGPEAQVREYVQTEVREVDLGGAVAVPGLQDAHGHLEGLGQSLEDVDLIDSRTFEEVIRRVAERAAQTPDGRWITGRGWDHTLWPGATFPHHRALSEAVPDHPVLIRRVDGHAALANRAAMELAGLVGGEVPASPEGGHIQLDAEGRPTGLLVDTAMGLVGRHVPAPDRGSKRRRILLAQERLLSEGLVAMHDMGTGATTLEVLQELEASGELKLRVIAYLSSDVLGDAAMLQRYPREVDLDPLSTCRVLGVKLYMDGALGSRGAAMLEEYHDAPGERGLPRMPLTDLTRLVGKAADAGLQPAVHAIGDAANRTVLDVFEARMQSDLLFAALRPRVEHAQVVAAADWERFERLGIIPSMQPRHATSDMRWAEARVGSERLLGAYAWKRLEGQHAPLAFGSDFPVEPSHPLRGLYAAITRQDEAGTPPAGWLPDQRLSPAAALEAFTHGAAYAAREDYVRGKLLPGFRADMSVLSVDPLQGSPEDLLTARVTLTVIDGEIVYDGRDSTPPTGDR